jgi:hypothetical protein
MEGKEGSATLDLTVLIQLREVDRPWAAEVINRESGERTLCATPLELLQLLAQLCRETGGQVPWIR